MADNNGTHLNLLKIHIKEEYSPTNIKAEDVDEEIVKTETEISGGSWVYQNVDINKLLANENQNLENSEEQLLNENSSIKEEVFEGDPKIWERISNLSTNCQKVNENRIHIDNENVDCDDEEKMSQQDFLHDGNDCLATDTLKKVLVSQKKCEKIVVLNGRKGKKHKSDHKVSQQDFNETTKINNEKEKLKFLLDHNYFLPISINHEKDVVLKHAKGKTQKLQRNGYNATEKKHKCNECSYEAQRKQDLLSHIRSRHAVEKPYKCNDCSYAAVKKSTLQFHIQSHHTMDKPNKCNECSYAAVKRSHLESHIKSCHTVEKPYKCNECSYVAVKKSYLRCHIKSRHTTDKPYKCNECSYAAVKRSHLESHIKSRHTAGKPYKCNECSYVAVKKSYLQCHIKFRHTTEKSYKCNECSYVAVKISHLQSHIKFRHITEKPYKCNECSYEAVKIYHLQSHIKSRHTTEKSYQCNECSYIAVRKSYLQSHIKSRHTTKKPYKLINQRTQLKAITLKDGKWKVITLSDR